jgi:hypothetical protein|tara:strand:+ start:638 stop:889 length:252 start_codon:yes stop_codon:yes gene_type:complete
MSAMDAVFASVLALFALVGLGLHDRRSVRLPDSEDDRQRAQAEADHAAASAELDARAADLATKAAEVAAAETGAEAFNAAFDD